jgi:hypothetical protein
LRDFPVQRGNDGGGNVGSVTFRSVLITIVIALAVLFAVNHSSKLKAVVGQQ